MSKPQDARFRFFSGWSCLPLGRWFVAAIIALVPCAGAFGAKPVITSATNWVGAVGVPFGYQIAASGNPTNFTAPGLPAGLTIDNANGLISGLPQTSGVATFNITAQNSNGITTNALTVSFSPPQPPV